MGSSPALAVTLNFFHTKSYDSEKSNLRFFDRFLKFFDFLKNYLLKSQVLVSMSRMGCEKLRYINNYDLIVLHKKYDP